MPKLTIDDLEKIRQRASKEISLRHGGATVTVTVHMDTCGIAAGARSVMDALLEEMARTDRDDIRVLASGCMGMCDTEPNVTVRVEGKDPVTYRHMDPEKMRRVFERHVLGGEVQSDLALAVR